jgi:integrase
MSAKTGQQPWGHIRKLESRRFQASYIGPDLKRYNGPRPFDSRTFAEGWLARERELVQLSAYNGTEWVSPVERRTRAAVRGETVQSYAKRWIENRNLAPRTRKLYADLLAKHIAPWIGAIGIGALSSDDVNRWHAKTLVDKPTARAHSYSLLHAICASAVEAELLIKNPCAIKRAMSTNRKREPVLLSVAELKAVAESMRPGQFKTLVLLSAWGALRFGEVTELRRTDFSDDYSMVTVSRGVTHHGQCVVKTPKSGTTRKVVLPPHIRADVKHHLDSFVDSDPESMLFPAGRRSRCGHLSQSVFSRAFVLACNSIGRKGVTHHSLRHLGATLAARAGASLAENMTRLGHSTARAAMIYQHSTDERQDDIAAALSVLAETANPTMSLDVK